MGALIRTRSGDTIQVALAPLSAIERLCHAKNTPVEFNTVGGETVVIFGFNVVESVRPCGDVRTHLVPVGTTPEPPKERRVIDTKGKKTK